MLSRKLLKSRKAISPILATLLLIVIAVAAIVVTYAWIMTYMSSAGQQAGIRLYKANINFVTGAPKKISIDVGNSGTSDAQISRVYVGTSGTSMLNQTTTPALPISLPRQSTVTITANYNWTAGATYYFRVVTTSGQALEWPDQAPT